MGATRVYDCIVPFGFNCMAAFQLRFRGLRQCSLPFDWVLCPLAQHAEAYVSLMESHFDGWLDERNFEVEDTRRNPVSRPHITVTDRRHGLVYYHDFLTYPLEQAELNKVQAKYQRRINRLYNLCGHAGRILFVVANDKGHLDRERLLGSRRRLSALFPKATIDIFAVVFGAPTFEVVEYPEDGLYFSLTPRGFTHYDLHRRPWEWAWLDSVRVSDSLRGLLEHPPRKPGGLLETFCYKLYKHLKKRLIRCGRLPSEFD